MAKYSVGDSVAADMHSKLNSQEYADLFKTAAKSDASSKEDSSSASDGGVSGSGAAGAHKNKPSGSLYGVDSKLEGGASAEEFKSGQEGTGKKDVSDAKDSKSEDSCSAEDKEDSCMADDQVLEAAVANLLIASAALDKVGFEKSATLTLDLASLVAEAAKKKKGKGKKDSKSSGKKSPANPSRPNKEPKCSSEPAARMKSLKLWSQISN